MTVVRRLADAEAVHGYLRRICFKTGPPVRVGAELEWITARRHDHRALVPLEELAAVLAAAGPFPGSSRVTMEPGGQVELSSAPAVGLQRCHSALTRDIEHLQRALAAADLVLVPSAIDPYRPSVRQLHEPRYDAMAAYFDSLPHELGRIMMASTAAVQVNLDAGCDSADVARRWALLHTVGPPLSAAFANSPRHRGRLTGWKSTRQAVWLHLDPARTHAPAGDDPAAAWSAYVLDAPVMMLRSDGGPWLARPGFTFAQWVNGEVAGLAAPTEDDLAYHLTTLFPPVRPRGWFEVRYLDAQAPQWWPVPVVVLATLLEHPLLAAVATEACEPVAGAWVRAARHGMDDGEMARSALAVFAAVVDAVEDRDLQMTVARFMEGYVERGRCPADDDVAPSPRSTRVPLARPRTPSVAAAQEPR